MNKKATVVGGGLAGVEAAYQIAKRGIAVDLHEMRPAVMTEAHRTGFLGEMVCSNSLGSQEIHSASGLLKAELRKLDSFFLKMADRFRVPAGNSLSVDRLQLAEKLSNELATLPGVTIARQEVTQIPPFTGPLLIASGPLTSPALAQAISSLTMRKNLFFYDATSPMILAESIDFNKMFAASRYGKGEADFFNIPLSQAQYDDFVLQLTQAIPVEMREFEKNMYFESCLPIEEMARRGQRALAYGPLKPVGLIDPVSGQMPRAVVQLRVDDLHRNFYQLVGFQTRLKWADQKRIFRTLPGLEIAEFERYGRMHRNTYINAPLLLNGFYQLRTHADIFFCGQISGVEGYLESLNSGLLSGLFAVCRMRELPQPPLPETTASGALAYHIANASWKDFRPSKFSFGLLPDRGVDTRNKKRKKELKAERALEELGQWIKQLGI